VDIVITIFLAMIALVVYFVPSLIANDKEHHQRAAIFALNLLLGWTFLGWVGALVWSLTATQGAPPKALPTAPPQTPHKEPERVENFVTAKNGQLTFRVLAYRRMDEEELRKVVFEALKAGKLKEPEPGGTATLVTDIGEECPKRASD
jgi:hypothetical protein